MYTLFEGILITTTKSPQKLLNRSSFSPHFTRRVSFLSLKLFYFKSSKQDSVFATTDCKMCGKPFPNRYTLKVHKKTHEGEKRYKCDLCPYSSIFQRHLESHMLIHTDQKPFQCDQCNQSFRQKQHLKRHQNLYHNPAYVPPVPKEKTHECPAPLFNRPCNVSLSTGGGGTVEKLTIFRHASVSSILLASLRPHKSSRRYCGGRHGV